MYPCPVLFNLCLYFVYIFCVHIFFLIISASFSVDSFPIQHELQVVLVFDSFIVLFLSPFYTSFLSNLSLILSYSSLTLLLLIQPRLLALCPAHNVTLILINLLSLFFSPETMLFCATTSLRQMVFLSHYIFSLLATPFSSSAMFFLSM